MPIPVFWEFEEPESSKLTYKKSEIEHRGKMSWLIPLYDPAVFWLDGTLKNQRSKNRPKLVRNKPKYYSLRYSPRLKNFLIIFEGSINSAYEQYDEI